MHVQLLMFIHKVVGLHGVLCTCNYVILTVVDIIAVETKVGKMISCSEHIF